MLMFYSMCCSTRLETAEERIEGMRKQFESVIERPELDGLVTDHILGLLEKIDVVGKGVIPVKGIEALCIGFGETPPDELRKFHEDDAFFPVEFDALMRLWFAERGNLAVDAILLKSFSARSWADECWKLGVRSEDVEEGEAVIFSETVVHALVRDSVPGLSEAAIYGKIRRWDHGGGAGSLTHDEFQYLYLYCLWLACLQRSLPAARSLLDSKVQALDAQRQVIASDRAEIYELSNAMKAQLEAVRSEVQDAVHARFNALFAKLDVAGNGSIPIEAAKVLFVQWGRVPPYNLRSFDTNRNNRFELGEFSALMKSFIVGKGKLVAERLLPKSKVAKAWCEACWDLGIRFTDTEDGEPAMHMKTVIELFARVAEITRTAKMTEEEAMVEYSKWDIGTPGQLRFVEFVPLYFHLLWIIYEGTSMSAKDRVANADVECVAAHTETEKPLEVSSIALKAHLERVCSELCGVINEEIHALFKKTDVAGNGHIPIEGMRSLFVEMDQAVPDLKAYDFNRNRLFERHEFDALMKDFFAGQRYAAVEYLLMYSSTALSWVKESWKLGVKSTDVHNGEVVMRAETLVDLFRQFAEINETSAMSEQEIWAEIRTVDADASGMLTLDKYANVYLYFLWVMYEEMKLRAVDQAASSDEEEAEADPADSALLMMQHLGRVRSEVHRVVCEQFHVLFQKKAEAGRGAVTIEELRALFVEMGHAVPNDLKADDADQSRQFEVHEFDAVIKRFFTGKGHAAVEHLLLRSPTALSWVDESWTLGVKSTNALDGKVELSVETVVELFLREAESAKIPGMSEEEIRAEIRKLDTDASGSLTFDEYKQLFLYFLWVMYEDPRQDPKDHASSSGEVYKVSSVVEREPSVKPESDGCLERKPSVKPESDGFSEREPSVKPESNG